MPQQDTFLAHRCEDGREQPILEHLRGAAGRARDFAAGFNGGQFAHDVALCHDIGKYSALFQRRIRGASVTADHSTPGGQALWERADSPTVLKMAAAYCVMGHHSGLPDGGSGQDMPDDPTLHGRLQRKTEDCSRFKDELELPRFEPPGLVLSDGFGAAFFIRMIFSALVDADFLDTEAFMQGGRPRGKAADMAALRDELLTGIEKFLNPAEPVSELNARRTALLKNCLAKAGREPGLFTLTAPTGSGKTIAGLAFALAHAAKYHKQRVIYVVPYNTIIEQNAAVFEDLLGAENVLQHHSQILYDDEGDEMLRKRLATENWDYPLVVTSSVQFFESLFGSRTSVCRKLHNIAGSVLIFDEAQMLPVPYLIPCVRAIRELVQNYGCTAVLATATQSSLERYFENMTPEEIADNPMELYAFMRRSTIAVLREPLTDEDLAGLLGGHEQVLCVVNTRKGARELFERLKKAQPDGAFHLSTLMYPAHRAGVLRKIRRRLKDGRPCRVVSTSLVEAGVDLDFPAVYREEAGLDSIVQAAGRCNREGKRLAADALTYVFSSADHKPPQNIRQNVDAARSALGTFADAASPEAVRAYFEQLFFAKGRDALDSKQVVSAFNDGLKSFSFPFKTAASKFRLIEQDTQTVFVLGAPSADDYRARGGAELTQEEISAEKTELEARLRRGERSRELFRKLGPYSLSPYRRDFQNLLDAGAIETLDRDDQIFLLPAMHYDSECGAALSPEGGQGIFL